MFVMNVISEGDRFGDMEMRQLEYFVVVADELSFSRGAARVHVAESAVSTAIAKLERELGIGLHTTMSVAAAAAGVGALLALFTRRGENAGTPVAIGH
jgi:Bacterial regulatory helix-turn-helix protein, lysR family